MGSFLKKVAEVGATAGATAIGGPAAGAAMAAGTGMLGTALKGGSLGDMLIGGATNTVDSYLGGKFGTSAPTSPTQIPAGLPYKMMGPAEFTSPSLLDVLNSKRV